VPEHCSAGVPATSVRRPDERSHRIRRRPMSSTATGCGTTPRASPTTTRILPLPCIRSCPGPSSLWAGTPPANGRTVSVVSRRRHTRHAGIHLADRGRTTPGSSQRAESSPRSVALSGQRQTPTSPPQRPRRARQGGRAGAPAPGCIRLSTEGGGRLRHRKLLALLGVPLDNNVPDVRPVTLTDGAQCDCALSRGVNRFTKTLVDQLDMLIGPRT